MAAKKSTLPNMVITLLVITLISGGVLGYVYNLTEAPIATAKTAKKIAAIKRVLPTFDNDPNAEMKRIPIDEKLSLEEYPATKDGKLVGVAYRTFTKKGFGGLVWLMVGFEPDGKIHNIEVLEHQETPGLGTKMAAPKFKDQFEGKNPATFNLNVTKDGGDVDAITAATISSRAFSDAVERAYKQFKQTKLAQKGGDNE